MRKQGLAQGAKRVPADRFDYNAALAQSTREQMLLNIVRSRYLEVPVFLTVSSVLTQYEYDRSVGLARRPGRRVGGQTDLPGDVLYRGAPCWAQVWLLHV